MSTARKLAMMGALLLAVACSEPAPSAADGAAPSTEAAAAEQPSEAVQTEAATQTAAAPASGGACASPSARVAGNYEEVWRGSELVEATPGTTTCTPRGQAAGFGLTCAVRGPANLSLDGYRFHTVAAGQTATYTLDADGNATCTLN